MRLVVFEMENNKESPVGKILLESTAESSIKESRYCVLSRVPVTKPFTITRESGDVERVADDRVMQNNGPQNLTTKLRSCSMVGCG